MQEIKYSYITRSKFKTIFWTGSIIGGLMWSIFGWLNAPTTTPIIEGLTFAGAVILSGTIAFCGGMLVRLKE